MKDGLPSEPSNPSDKILNSLIFSQVTANTTIKMGLKIDVSEIAKPFRDDIKAKVNQLKESGLGRSFIPQQDQKDAFYSLDSEHSYPYQTAL